MSRTVWLLLAVCFLQTGIIWGLAAVIFTQQRIIFALGSPDLRRSLSLLLPRWFIWLATRMTRSGWFRQRRPAQSRTPSAQPDPVSFVSTYE